MAIELTLIRPLLDKNMCPICNRRFEDILKHFTLEHNIKDMEQLKLISSKAAKKEDSKKAYYSFIEELKRKLKAQEISPEDYRELSMKWCKDHKT
jgi:hypothetical protein